MISPTMYSGLSGRKMTACPNINNGPIIQFWTSEIPRIRVFLKIRGSSSYFTFASGGYIIRINPMAIVWVAICVIIFCLPFTPAGVPWRDEFDIRYVNYAPITVGLVLLIVGLWWTLKAKHTFKGPVRTVEFADDGVGVDE